MSPADLVGFCRCLSSVDPRGSGLPLFASVCIMVVSLRSSLSSGLLLWYFESIAQRLLGCLLKQGLPSFSQKKKNKVYPAPVRKGYNGGMLFGSLQ